MSRIDEALRRESARTALDPRGVLSIADTSAHAFALEQYPVEALDVPDAVGAVTADAADALQVVQPDAARTARQAIVGTVTQAPARWRHSPSADRCRRIAVALRDAHAARGLHTVMVSSAVPHEEHAAVAVDLALALSHLAPRVLLVDADLQQPALHDLLGCANGVGLGECLTTGRHVLPVLEVSTQICVLPAGHSGASAMGALTSERMSTLIDECAVTFDWIVLSTPPVSLLPDAPLLARRAGAVAFVIGARTPFAVSQRAMTLIDRALIVGTVLTGLDSPNIPSNNIPASHP